TALVVTFSGSGPLDLFNARPPETRRRLDCKIRLGSICLSPDGKTLATASEGGSIELWDTTSLERSAFWQGTVLGYHSVTISPDGERVAAGSNGQEAIKLWDLHSREELAAL